MRIIRVLTVVAVSGLAACGDSTEPAAIPASVEILGGNGQQALGNETLPDSLRVRVLDSRGMPVSWVLMEWTANAGAISPFRTRTDASGMTAAKWAFYNPAVGFAPVGTHTATATIVGGSSTVFSAHARAGAMPRSVSITPDRVNASSGPATVTVAVRATDDWSGRGVQFILVEFYAGIPGSWGSGSLAGELKLVSGNAADGVWQATLTVPQGAAAGPWTLDRLTVGWGCGSPNRRTYFSSQLATAGMPHRFTVMAGSSQLNLLSAPRPGEAPPKLSVSSSC